MSIQFELSSVLLPEEIRSELEEDFLELANQVYQSMSKATDGLIKL